MTGIEYALLAAITAESARKQHVAARIGREQQERQAKKAEKQAKDQEAKNLMIRQQEKKRQGMTQKTPVTKNPFAGGRKDMRSQFTIGGGGSESGANY